MAVLKLGRLWLAGVLAVAPLSAAADDTPDAGPVARAHRTIATASAAAQTAFDRGLIMLYAFNIGEARIAFRAAESADPGATLAYVGEAVADTIDINRPTTSEGEERGATAIARGRAAAAAAPEDERALFAATALRFDRRRSQSERFAHYFTALQSYSDMHQTDGLGATLAAYAGWNATGVLTSGPHGALTTDAQRIADDLDRALRVDPDDAGAHHLRIHFWEQADVPQRALPDADYLAGLHYAPGESHLQHMAGHIYDRLGQYEPMIAVNQAACANDATYFALGRGAGQEYMRTYHAHDVDFVLYGLTTVGQSVAARTFAAHESADAGELVALREHDNRRVLALLGAAITPMRAIAEARLGAIETARSDLAGLPATGDGGTDTDIARAAVARAAGDTATAIASYRKARAAAGSDLGDPKLHWSTPVGEGLGATLLEAHRAAEAERVFDEELTRYPRDPRLEFGLAQALAAQGKDDAEARSAYTADWKGEKALTVADLG